MARFTESVVEEEALDWLETLDYAIHSGPDTAPGELLAERADYDRVVLERWLREALQRLNPALPAEAIDEAFRRLTRPDGPTLETRNHTVHRILTEGVTVEYRRPDGSIAGAQARVLDYDDADNNDFIAVNQFTVIENGHNRRPDMVIFVNGLPIAVIELKNAADENATIWSAYQQFQTYKNEIPSLFAHNCALVISNGVQARIGTLTG